MGMLYPLRFLIKFHTMQLMWSIANCRRITVTIQYPVSNYCYNSNNIKS